MVVETLTITDRDVLPRLLMGRVFHLTTRTAYNDILRAGEISNNQSGHLPVNTSSKGSFGRLLGYVSLFDLRASTPEIIQKTLDCYDFRGPSWFARYGRKYTHWNLAYLFLNSEYYDQLIPNAMVHEHYKKTGRYLLAIPDSEVWVDQKIPLDWIGQVLIVNIKEQAPGRSTPAEKLYWAALEAEKKVRLGTGIVDTEGVKK
jgi:hypothetical protein